MTFAHNSIRERSGQSLIEVLVGLAIGGILIGASTFALLATLRASSHTQNSTIGQELNDALMNEMRAIAGARWQELLLLPRGSNNLYTVIPTVGVLNVTSTLFLDRIKTINGILYRSNFFLDDVYRLNGNIVTSSTSGAMLDSALQQVTVITTWSKQGMTSTTVVNTDYLIRAHNVIFRQNDWSGGATGGESQEGNTNTYATSNNIFIDINGSVHLDGF